VNSDKILRISVETQKSYKSQKASLQLEFTGKHTNGIVIDESGKVLQAVRHITDSVSSRTVKVGTLLQSPPPPNFTFKSGEQISDIEEFLYNQFQNFEDSRLRERRDIELRKVDKRVESFQKIYDSLSDSSKLLEESEKYREWGDVLLSNLHIASKWGSYIELPNFSGETVKIPRIGGAKDNTHLGNILYNQSRRFRQKSENLHIERDSLQDKINFLKKMRSSIERAENLNVLRLLTYRGEKRKREKRENEMYEVFWIEGFKVLLGKSERGNSYLLKNSKAKNIWIHLKDRPSAHTIIITDKSNVPDSVIYESAKLTVQFSVSELGNYLVDYTARRNVKTVSGSNVNYINYKTVSVDYR
jgi:predicted ribosome quality control (RQC) complex YloA/Tae2 family protein